MRAYAPVSWEQLAELVARGALPGPLRACTVDPAWRAGAPEVDEEQWEYEAQVEACARLADEPGMVLAVDPAEGGDPEDGWVRLPGPIRRAQVAALLDEELGWFAAQEAAGLLAERT